MCYLYFKELALLNHDTKGLLKSVQKVDEKLDKLEGRTDQKFHDPSTGIHQKLDDINKNIDQRFKDTEDNLNGLGVGMTVFALSSVAYICFGYMTG